jgi:hypothetical protein
MFKNKTTRITLDLPINLHTKIKTLTSQTGQTLKQFFIKISTKQLENKNLSTPQKTRKMPKPIALGVDNIDLQNLIETARYTKF